MHVESVYIEGLKIIHLDCYEDERGFFVERFKLSKFLEENLETNFIQDNHSCSLPNVIRGLHYQHNPSQGKLVSCISGSIFDVAVDLRSNSKTFGKHFSIILDQSKLFWIPEGFAHGFCALGNKESHLYYKISNGEYSSKNEGGVIWNDKDLNINWPIENPVISEKDYNLQSFSSYKKNVIF